jgi:hypothetical protein
MTVLYLLTINHHLLTFTQNQTGEIIHKFGINPKNGTQKIPKRPWGPKKHAQSIFGAHI